MKGGLSLVGVSSTCSVLLGLRCEINACVLVVTARRKHKWLRSGWLKKEAIDFSALERALACHMYPTTSPRCLSLQLCVSISAVVNYLSNDLSSDTSGVKLETLKLNLVYLKIRTLDCGSAYFEEPGEAVTPPATGPYMSISPQKSRLHGPEGSASVRFPSCTEVPGSTLASSRVFPALRDLGLDSNIGSLEVLCPGAGGSVTRAIEFFFFFFFIFFFCLPRWRLLCLRLPWAAAAPHADTGHDCKEFHPNTTPGHYICYPSNQLTQSL